MRLLSLAITRLCIFFAICITAIALLSTTVSNSYLLELFSPFQVQYLIAVVVLGVVVFVSMALTKERSRLSLVFIIFCAAILSVRIATWYLPGAIVNKATNQYRIMSTNLNVANTDAAKVLALTEKEQPDLAVFIEVNDEMAKQLDTLKQTYPYSTNQLTPYQPGGVMYSKYPLTDFNIRKFNTNNAVNLTVHTQIDSQPISVVVIHPLPPVKREFFKKRNTVFKAVTAYIKRESDPVLLIGDFNVTMWSPQYQKLARQTGLNNTRKGLGILPTWPVNVERYFSSPINPLLALLKIPIDHCLASPIIHTTAMHTGSEVGSDHLPIVVDFAIQPTVSTNSLKLYKAKIS